MQGLPTINNAMGGAPGQMIMRGVGGGPSMIPPNMFPQQGGMPGAMGGAMQDPRIMAYIRALMGGGAGG